MAKNRLVKLALEGTDAKGIADLLRGPTCIAYSADPVAAPKIAVKFAKTNEKFVILGGAMGTTVLDAQGVSTLANLPSLDELRVEADRSRAGAGEQDRPRGQCARRSAGARVCGLRQDR